MLGWTSFCCYVLVFFFFKGFLYAALDLLLLRLKA